MSGILLPMIHSVKTINQPSDPVGVDHIVDIAQLDTNVTGTGGGSLEYAIVFNVNASGGQTPREIVWRYATLTDRKDDMASILTALSRSMD